MRNKYIINPFQSSHHESCIRARIYTTSLVCILARVCISIICILYELVEYSFSIILL